jgi:hypothetical protein
MMMLKLRIRQTYLTSLMMLLMVGICIVGDRAVAVVRIEVEASEFSASTYLTEQQQAEVREKKYLERGRRGRVLLHSTRDDLV